MSEPVALSKSSKRNVRKGQRCESQARRAIKDLGFPACRTVALSGSLSWLGIPELCGDLKAGFVLGEGGREATVQCKSRKSGGGFAQIGKWLADVNTDILWLKNDRCEPIVAMSAQTFSYFLSLVPPEHRLEPIKDRWAGLRRAAATNSIAAAALKKVESFKTEEELDAEEFAKLEVPETESKPPF